MSINMIKTIGCSLTGMTMLLSSMNVHSLTITTTRLFLNPDNKITSMSVYNKDAKPLFCSIEVRNLDVVDGGVVLTDEKVSKNPSPKGLVKLSPKRFTLKPLGHQAFKAIYRKRPNIDDGEYIGAVAIKCEDDVKSEERIRIKPILVHNIPLIVRTKNLKADVVFSELTKSNNSVSGRVAVVGERLITGDLRLIESDSGKVLKEKKKVSFYPSSVPQRVVFDTIGLDVDNLALQYEEIEESGNLTFKQDVN